MRSWRDLTLLTLTGFLLRLCFLPNPGHMLDVQTFGQWALAAADNPWNRAYEATNMNYPPGALLVFEVIGRGYRMLIGHDPDHFLLRAAIKLPNVLFDCIGGIVIYAIARRYTKHYNALFASALFVFNPAIIFDSSVWGMNDTITATITLIAAWCILRGNRFAGWIFLGFAILNKPPVLVIAPLFILETFVTAERKQWIERAAGVCSSIIAVLILGWIVAYPFYTDHRFLAVYQRMFSWYIIGSSLYPYTSVNAFNVHALYADFFRTDTALVCGIALKYWADLAFIAVASFIYARYARLRDDRALLESCFLILLAFFLFLTEMHERYLIYALTFAPVLSVFDGWYRWATVALTITEWLNLEYSLAYMWINFDKPEGINPKGFAPVLARLCALTNIGVFLTFTSPIVPYIARILPPSPPRFHPQSPEHSPHQSTAA
jgi:dolichyl-phosphate-mannose-protein mannosyltransferase